MKKQTLPLLSWSTRLGVFALAAWLVTSSFTACVTPPRTPQADSTAVEYDRSVAKEEIVGTWALDLEESNKGTTVLIFEAGGSGFERWSMGKKTLPFTWSFAGDGSWVTQMEGKASATLRMSPPRQGERTLYFMRDGARPLEYTRVSDG
jgi:hypothetical protein